MRFAVFLFVSFLLFPVTASANLEMPLSPYPAHIKKVTADIELADIAPEAGTVMATAGEGALPVSDIDESYDLPEYPMGARIATGKMDKYVIHEEDTMLDIARHFGYGFVEIRAANRNIDPWTPVPGEEVVLPGFHLLPRARQEGIVVNLGEMRLFHFRKPGEEPDTYPIGIGREGLQTPTGNTSILRKVAGPRWYPTERMRKEKPFLPEFVEAGSSNPLGTHALYLGWPTFLIHGTNKPWGIGRRLSSGCMRMYPEDIRTLFKNVPVGTKVTVVDQPVLVGWLDDGLYLEANPSKTQSNEIEITGKHTVRPLTDDLKAMIINAAGVAADKIDWVMVEKTLRERQGYPVKIASATREKPVEKPAARLQPASFNQ